MSQEVCRPGSSRQSQIPQSRTRQRYSGECGRAFEGRSIGIGRWECRSCQGAHSGGRTAFFFCGVAGDAGVADEPWDNVRFRAPCVAPRSNHTVSPQRHAVEQCHAPSTTREQAACKRKQTTRLDRARLSAIPARRPLYCGYPGVERTRLMSSAVSGGGRNADRSIVVQLRVAGRVEFGGTGRDGASSTRSGWSERLRGG